MAMFFSMFFSRCCSYSLSSDASDMAGWLWGDAPAGSAPRLGGSRQQTGQDCVEDGRGEAEVRGGSQICFVTL
jgi:hypothetical protein